MERSTSEPWGTRPAVGEVGRYTLTAQALHWLTALLILAIVPVA